MTESDFDKLISAAMVKISEDQDDVKTNTELKSLGVPEHQFSTEFEKKMSRMIKEEIHVKGASRHHKHRIVAAIIICCFISGTVICSVDAVRVPMINFLLNLTASNSNIVTSSPSNADISAEFRKLLPSYVPDNFVVSNKDEKPSEYISLEYANGEGLYYDLSCSLRIESNAIDTEDSSYSEMPINGRNAYICEKNDRILAAYYTDTCTYIISGNISIEEIEKIFSSI